MRHSLALCLSAVGACTALPGVLFAEDLVAHNAEPRTLAELSVATGGDALFAPVAVAGKEYSFLLQVGASRVFVDDSLRAPLQKAARDHGEALEADEVPSLPMRLGGLEFRPEHPIKCADLTAFREAIGRNVDGLVGLDFLRGRVVQIDFDAGKIRVLSSCSEHNLDDCEMSFVRVRESDPSIPLKFSDFRLESFVLDTVLEGCLGVRSSLMDDLVGEGMLLEPSSSPGEPPPPPGLARFGLLDELTVGKWKHRRLEVWESRFQRVGLAYLSRFRLEFDFRDMDLPTLYMEKGARFDKPDLPDWSGMELVLRDKKVVVSVIRPSAVAAKAGVREGDVLVEVDRKPATELSLFQIRRHFTGEQKPKLRFARPGGAGKDAQIITARLASPFPPGTFGRAASATSDAGRKKR